MMCGVSLSADFSLLVRGRSRLKMWAPLWSCLLSYLVILWPMARCTKNHALPHLPHPNNAKSTARPTSAATPFVGQVHLIAPYAEDLKWIKTTGSQVKLRSSMVQSLSTCEMNCQARWLPAANGYATDSKSARPKCPKRLNLRTMLALAMDMVGKS